LRAQLAEKMSIAARLVLAVEDTAQIVVSDVQGHCGEVRLQLLAEPSLKRANRLDDMRSVKFERST
jgi:hypothetical protein